MWLDPRTKQMPKPRPHSRPCHEFCSLFKSQNSYSMSPQHHAQADVSLPTGIEGGVLATIGGRYGGWSYYLDNGYLKFFYNLAGAQRVGIPRQDIPYSEVLLKADEGTAYLAQPTAHRLGGLRDQIECARFRGRPQAGLYVRLRWGRRWHGCVSLTAKRFRRRTRTVSIALYFVAINPFPQTSWRQAPLPLFPAHSVTNALDVLHPAPCSFTTGGMGILYVDGQQVGQGRIERTLCCRFSLDETFDVGADVGTSANPQDYNVPNEFKGKMRGLTVNF